MSEITRDGWIRATPARPCPTCGRKKFCLTHPERRLIACTSPNHPSEVYWEGIQAHVHGLDGQPVGSDWRDAIRPPAAEPSA